VEIALLNPGGETRTKLGEEEDFGRLAREAAGRTIGGSKQLCPDPRCEDEAAWHVLRSGEGSGDLLQTRVVCLRCSVADQLEHGSKSGLRVCGSGGKHDGHQREGAMPPMQSILGAGGGNSSPSLPALPRVDVGP
jgi:hypothetical protein